MMRFWSCLLPVLWALAAVSAPAADTRPNILFLLADDQRADALGAYGNEHIRTPNLDAIVRRGYSFRRAYCMGSTHGAVCQPSRAMLLSGRSLYRAPLDLADTPILPELLRGAGYATFITGKWHNDAPALLRGFDQGEAIMLGGMSDHEAVPVQDISPGGKLVNKRTGEKFSSELFADAAIGFLERHGGEHPFFAYVSFTAPHDPRQPPQPWRDYYYEHLPPLPENFLPQHPFDNGWLIGRDENLAAWPRTEPVVRAQIAEYYGMISHLDGQIGRIMRTLEARGLAENTVVVYAADNGLALGSHGLLGKQNAYEHSMRVPLVLAGPGIPGNAFSNALIYLMDLMPTLCHIGGVAPPPGVEGVNLSEIWQGRRDRVRESVYLAYEDSQRALREERWKLIRYPVINYTQLFDLERDPYEMRNLAEDPAQTDRVSRMLETLAAGQRQLDDETPLSSDAPVPRFKDLSGTARAPDVCQPEWIIEKYFK